MKIKTERERIMINEYCVVCEKLIPEKRKNEFPKRKLITCCKKCSNKHRMKGGKK